VATGLKTGSTDVIFSVIKRTKAACRQVELRNAETSTTDLLGSKHASGSHLVGGGHEPPNWLHRYNNF